LRLRFYETKLGLRWFLVIPAASSRSFENWGGFLFGARVLGSMGSGDWGRVVFLYMGIGCVVLMVGGLFFVYE
jgi:hypothetical protein